AAAETAAALHLTRAVIGLCGTEGPDTDLARIRAVAGPAAGRSGDPGALRLSEHPAYAVRAAEGTALVRDAAREDPGFAELIGTPFLPAAVQARLDLPMLVSGRLEGLLWCEREHAQPWTADEEAFVAAVAAKVLASLQHWRQREAERQLRELNLHLEDLVAARTRELSTSEARLAEALDATNDGLWEFDLASGAVYFSPVWARLLGYAPDEVRPHVDFFWQTVHPDDIGRVQAVVADHLEGRRPSKELEVRLRTKGGEYRWFLDQGRVVQRAADGTPQRMVGTISDITERKRALQDLRDSEERFRAVFDKSPVIVALVRMADSRIAEMNEAGLQAFGYSRAEMIGRTTFELDLWVNETQRRASAGLLIHEGVVSGFELQLRRKNGEQFWGLLSSSQITLNGEPYSLNTVQDITARRELEARFLQSQKMEVVGHLAGGIAHDFNNVLTVITGTAELAMAGTGADDPMHEALATIRDASARAAGLTGQLMAFSRRQILQPVVLDLNDVVAGLEAMLRRVLGALVNLTITAAARPAMVVADRGSLEQVILNLAINARDAMPNGGDLRIDVALATIHAGQHDTRHTLRPGPYVTVTVADTGTGMSDAVAQRIFEPFFTTKAVGKGTGLGLSMAHGVVSQSGGDIVVRSAVGAGSSFTIYLPWVEHAVAASALPAGAPAGGHENILVVDDNREIREVVRRVLSFSGYHVLTAEHGEDALRVLAEHAGRVALLLTDVVMPGLNGRELAARVHASFPHVRVLFTSGYADDAIAHHGVLAKGVEFIAKPYSLQALARKVRDVLDAPV
ncbi:MAG: PAS domain S-box protein, partial [Acidobacteria bacterium]|nr:PAS domain S-box protein [Acidobacteriota bacterium]